jgi:hypothetical protein
MGYLIDPETIIVPRLPDLEPAQFWFVVRASGQEQRLRDWVASLNDPGTEEEPNPVYDPVDWAAASSKFDFAKIFERDEPFVDAARDALGITAEQFDDLWSYAAR